MKATLIGKIGALAMAAALSIGPGVATAGDLAVPVGTWQTKDRLATFQVEACGDRANQLCVKLVSLKGAADDKDTHPYIGKYIIQNARPNGHNKWLGFMSAYGQSGTGRIVWTPGKELSASGCAFAVVCRTYRLVPGI